MKRPWRADAEPGPFNELVGQGLCAGACRRRSRHSYQILHLQHHRCDATAGRPTVASAPSLYNESYGAGDPRPHRADLVKQRLRCYSRLFRWMRCQGTNGFDHDARLRNGRAKRPCVSSASHVLMFVLAWPLGRRIGMSAWRVGMESAVDWWTRIRTSPRMPEHRPAPPVQHIARHHAGAPDRARTLIAPYWVTLITPSHHSSF